MRRIQGADIGPANTYKERNPATNDPGTKVADDALNDIQEELSRGIESTGDTVDVTDYEAGTGDRDQVFKAVAHYGAGGASRFIEEGTSASDAYVIQQDTIGVLQRNAPSALFDDQEISFLTSNANTGASTIDVSLLLGQSLGTTIKTLVTITGAALPAGYIRTDTNTRARYDLPGDRFLVDRQIEDGSNANGRFTRCANGDVKMWGNSTISPAAESTVSPTITLPATIVSVASTEVLGIMKDLVVGTSWLVSRSLALSATQAQFQFRDASGANRTDSNVPFGWLLMGRWY